LRFNSLRSEFARLAKEFTPQSPFVGMILLPTCLSFFLFFTIIRSGDPTTTLTMTLNCMQFFFFPLLTFCMPPLNNGCRDGETNATTGPPFQPRTFILRPSLTDRHRVASMFLRLLSGQCPNRGAPPFFPPQQISPHPLLVKPFVHPGSRLCLFVNDQAC